MEPARLDGACFIGLGINDPMASWGKMVGISNAYVRVTEVGPRATVWNRAVSEIGVAEAAGTTPLAADQAARSCRQLGGAVYTLLRVS